MIFLPSPDRWEAFHLTVRGLWLTEFAEPLPQLVQFRHFILAHLLGEAWRKWNFHVQRPLQASTSTARWDNWAISSFFPRWGIWWFQNSCRSPLNLESWKLLVTFKIHQKNSNYQQESVKPDFKQLISHENRFPRGKMSSLWRKSVQPKWCQEAHQFVHHVSWPRCGSHGREHVLCEPARSSAVVIFVTISNDQTAHPQSILRIFVEVLATSDTFYAWFGGTSRHESQLHGTRCGLGVFSLILGLGRNRRGRGHGEKSARFEFKSVGSLL